MARHSLEVANKDRLFDGKSAGYEDDLEQHVFFSALTRCLSRRSRDKKSWLMKGISQLLRLLKAIGVRFETSSALTFGSQA